MKISPVKSSIRKTDTRLRPTERGPQASVNQVCDNARQQALLDLIAALTPP